MLYKEKELKEVYLIEYMGKEGFLDELRSLLKKIKYRENSYKIHFQSDGVFYTALVEELKTKTEHDYL